MEEQEFDKFCEGFGFSSYPFNAFTAENEKNELERLFVSTKLYSPIIQSFKAGQTLIISGDRGTGKTSILYDFSRHASEKVLFCKVDDYAPLPEKYSEPDIYKFLIKVVANAFFQDAAKGKLYHGKLSDDERALLAYYFVNFASDGTRGLANRAIKKIQISPVKRFGIGAYNFFRNPLNILANASTTLLADIVAKATGAAAVNQHASEYFPEISAALEAEFPPADGTFEALRRLNQLVLKAGYDGITVVFDKIDEDNRFDNAAEEIAEYIAPILANNKLLLDDTFQFVCSLWVVPLNFIKDKVRTQKISSPLLKWHHDDLIRAFDRRIEVFSGKTESHFSNIFAENVSSELKLAILDLSNGNPRDLWHLFNQIFRCQFAIDSSAAVISREACEKGMVAFVDQFNFYEYYPRKANARANSMDVYAYIKHLQKLDSPTFTRNQLNDKAGTGSSTLNYTVGIENLGLIDKDVTGKGENQYSIRDPKVLFALEHNIEIKKPN